MFEALRPFFLLICTFLPTQQLVFAQNVVELQVRSQDDVEDILNRYKFKQKHADSLAAIRTINQLIKSLHNDGFLIANLKGIEGEGNFLFAEIEVGPPFEWIELRPGNVDPLLLRRVSYQKNGLRANRFDYNQLARLENDILRYGERNGYPFASLIYDSLSITEVKIGASLNLNLGPEITFDSIRVNDQVVKRPFLESYLGIQMGDLYDEFKVERTVQQIRSMPYVRIVSDATITFQNKEATLYFDLEKRRINKIDGVIGFLPNSNSTNGLLVTGQFDMELYNPFLSGKYIGIHWRSPQERSQTLNMRYEHPNLLRSPVSFQGDFKFLKQDTTFTNLNFRADLDVKFGRASSISVFTSISNSNLLSTTQFENATSLPEFADIDQTLYGVALNLKQLDDLLLPKTGTKLYFSAGLGNKKIQPIDELPSSIYDGVALSSVQYQVDLAVAHYFYLQPRWNVKLAIDGGWIENPNLFVNDAYRIGGLNSIRGFNENFFFATKYLTNTVENRFYFESNSYLSLFADFGVLENVAESEKLETFIGFGTGISFETQRGIFNLVYAMGASETAGPVNSNRSKIHFGFTTRF